MRQLLAIREHGSLARAAKVLNMSQPSISKSIARLEDELTVKLFDRTAAGSELTPIGGLIADRAERVLAELDGLKRDAALAAGGGAMGYLRLGIGTSLTYDFLPRLALRIADAHPDVDVHFEINERERLLPSLLARELDVIICAPGEAVEGTVVLATELFRSKRVAAAAPGHPLAGRRRVPVAELTGYRRAGGATLQLDTAELSGFLDHFAPGPRPYTSNYFEALLPLAVAGKTIMIAPRFLLRPLVAAGALVELDIDWDHELTFAATTMRSARFSPILNKIVRYAAEVGAELEADWRGGAAPSDDHADLKADALADLMAARQSGSGG